MRKPLLSFIIISVFSSTLWAVEEVTPELSRVDQILAQIKTLSNEEQSELVKKLIAQKTDDAIADTKEKVKQVKQQIQDEINDPKYQQHLNKAKRKLKKLYDLFQDDEEIPQESSKAI